VTSMLKPSWIIGVVLMAVGAAIQWSSGWPLIVGGLVLIGLEVAL
jgi:hypothetical protein